MRRKKGRPWLLFARDSGVCACVAGAAIWLLAKGSAQSGYNWQWYRMGAFLRGPLLEGLGVTLMLAGAAMLLALVVGLAGALAARSRSRVARAFALLHVELIRGTPLLVQLFVIYFIIAPVLGWGQILSAVLALALFEGAYLSEIFRASINAVPKEQWEAAASLGFSRAQALRLVILPQAFLHSLPPMTGELVNLVKNTALVSIIAVTDLTMRGQVFIADTFLSLETWLMVAAVYLVLTGSLSVFASFLERRLALYR